MRTDGWTDLTKLIVAFRNFANAPKTYNDITFTGVLISPSEACQVRARFQQHRDANCHQVFLSCKARRQKEIHAILTETLACFLPGRAKDLSAPLRSNLRNWVSCWTR